MENCGILVNGKICTCIQEKNFGPPSHKTCWVGQSFFESFLLLVN